MLEAGLLKNEGTLQNRKKERLRNVYEVFYVALRAQTNISKSI